MTTPIAAIGSGRRPVQPASPGQGNPPALSGAVLGLPIAYMGAADSAASIQVLAAMYRQRQVVLSQQVMAAVAALWTSYIAPSQFADSWAGLRPIIMGLIRQYFNASAADSAQLFQQMRVLSDLGAGRVPFVDLPQQELDKVVDSQSIGTFFKQIGNGLDESQASGIAERSLEGSSSRLVLKGGRQTMVEAVHSDPMAIGWERVISGAGACSFCSMLASRGAAYKSQKQADFRAHDHCNCTAVPLFRGQAPSQASQDLASQWQQATHGKSGSAARQAWNDYWNGKQEAVGVGSEHAAVAEPQETGAGYASQLDQPVG